MFPAPHLRSSRNAEPRTPMFIVYALMLIVSLAVAFMLLPVSFSRFVSFDKAVAAEKMARMSPAERMTTGTAAVIATMLTVFVGMCAVLFATFAIAQWLIGPPDKPLERTPMTGLVKPACTGDWVSLRVNLSLLELDPSVKGAAFTCALFREDAVMVMDLLQFTQGCDRLKMILATRKPALVHKLAEPGTAHGDELRKCIDDGKINLATVGSLVARQPGAPGMSSTSWRFQVIDERAEVVRRSEAMFMPQCAAPTDMTTLPRLLALDVAADEDRRRDLVEMMDWTVTRAPELQVMRTKPNLLGAGCPAD